MSIFELVKTLNMSVLIEFAMFPTDKGASVSKYVSRVIDMIRKDYSNYKLTAMGTIVETETISQALEIVEKAHDMLSEDSHRIYSSIKIDSQKNRSGRLQSKINSITGKIGEVKT